MATLIAKQKVWRTHKNELVEDGHVDAASLVAPRGAQVAEEDVQHFKGSDKFFVEADSREGEAVLRQPDEPKPAWSAADIAAYRNAREGDEPVKSTIEKIVPPAKKTPAAEKMRKSRPGPENASKGAKKTASAKTAE